MRIRYDTQLVNGREYSTIDSSRSNSFRHLLFEIINHCSVLLAALLLAYLGITATQCVI
jgi:hypothetical protein